VYSWGQEVKCRGRQLVHLGGLPAVRARAPGAIKDHQDHLQMGNTLLNGPLTCLALGDLVPAANRHAAVFKPV